MTRVLQYAKTTDPDVLAAVAEGERIRLEFNQAALAFAEKHASPGDEPTAIVDHFAGSRRVVGIHSTEKPTSGRWTRGYSGRGWRPYKSNAAYDEMAALHRRAPEVPGAPTMVDGEYRSDGSHMSYFPAVFAVDGAAYFGMGGLPAKEQHGRDAEVGPQWTEILGSEFMAAKEACEAQRRTKGAGK